MGNPKIADHAESRKRIADATIEILARSELELRDDNTALREYIVELQSERDEALIDREVFRRWMVEWAPAMIAELIRLATENRQVRRVRADLRRVEDDYRRLRERVLREETRTEAA